MGLVAFLAELLRCLPSALSGPVFRQDLFRMVRRSRLFLYRGGYLLMLLGALGWVYLSWFASYDLLNILNGSAVSPSQVGRLATAFTGSLVVAQFLAVLIFTPALSATAIAEEKERHTLLYLLLTPLSSAEIILGKWAGRVAYLLLFLLAGLPVFALLQLLGGVDAGLMLFAFGVTACNIAGLAAVGMLCSVWSSTSGSAIVRTYVLTLAYQVISGISVFCCLIPSGSITKGPIPILLTGNIVFLLLEVDTVLSGGSPGPSLLSLFTNSAVFHALVVAGCCSMAIYQLRRNSWPKEIPVRSFNYQPKEGDPKSQLVMLEPVSFHPPVTDRPILWKEKHFGLSSGFGGFFDFLLFIICPPLGVVYFAVLTTSTLANETQLTEVLTMTGAAAVSYLMLLMLGLSSAATISRELEQRTLECLLATPLSRRSILLEKLEAGFVRAIGYIWVLLAIWVLGLIAQATDFISIFLSLLIVSTFAAFYALLGLWLSFVCSSTFQARVWLLLTLLLHTTLPLLLQSSELALPWVLYTAAEPVKRSAPRLGTNVGTLLFVVPWFWLATLSMWMWTERKFGKSS